MPDSDFVYEQGEPIDVGSHGFTDFVFAGGDEVPNEGNSDIVFESGVGLGAAGRVYACDDDHLYRLNYEDLSVDDKFTPPFDPHGAGGDEVTFWTHEQNGDTIHRLNPNTWDIEDSFSVTDKNREFTEIGGDSEYALAADTENDEFIKIDADTHDIVETISAPDTSGSGGDDVYAYTCSFAVGVEQRDSDTLAVQQTANVGGEGPVGVGGGELHVYVANDSGGPSNDLGDRIIELDPETLEVVRNEPTPTDSLLLGIGGI